jgi:hypothetical protein
MFPAMATRNILLLTVLCWTVQPTLSRSAALVEASESGASEIAKEVDWEKFNVACLSSLAVHVSLGSLSADLGEAMTLSSKVNVRSLGHLRGPPTA